MKNKIDFILPISGYTYKDFLLDLIRNQSGKPPKVWTPSSHEIIELNDATQGRMQLWITQDFQYGAETILSNRGIDIYDLFKRNNFSYVRDIQSDSLTDSEISLRDFILENINKTEEYALPSNFLFRSVIDASVKDLNDSSYFMLLNKHDSKLIKTISDEGKRGEVKSTKNLYRHFK